MMERLIRPVGTEVVVYGMFKGVYFEILSYPADIGLAYTSVVNGETGPVSYNTIDDAMVSINRKVCDLIGEFGAR